VSDLTLLDQVLGRCDVVLSLTALCNPSLYNTRPLQVIDASYADLVPLVDRCTRQNKWLIHFSTCEVYGRMALDSQGRPAALMNEEETAYFLGPIHRERWTYACAKQLLERRLWAAGQHEGLSFTIIRPFNVIGSRMDFIPGIDGEGIPRVLACFMEALLAGKELQLVDGGAQRRSFVAVEDFCAAVARIIDRRETCRGEVFNLGNPTNDVTIARLATRLAKTYAALVPDARPVKIRAVSARDFYGDGYDDVQARVPDIAKARRLLDWEPTITLDAMLPGIIDDYVRRYGSISSSREALVVSTRP
jgi:UDP-apiose/xylose synthase